MHNTTKRQKTNKKTSLDINQEGTRGKMKKKEKKKGNSKKLMKSF